MALNKIDRENLKNLLQDQDKFTQFVLSRKRFYISKSLKNIINISKKLKNPNVFLTDITQAVINTIENIPSKPWNHQGNDIANALFGLEPFLTQDNKNKITDLLYVHQGWFYSYAKKNVAKVMLNFIEFGDDPRIVGAINSFARVLDLDDVRKFISKSTNYGINNTQIIDAINNNAILKLLEYDKYNEEEINSNDELRKKIIKDLARGTALIKKMPFKLEAKIEDIKDLPPALRFKFLQTVFANEIRGTTYAMKYGYNSHYINPTFKKFKVPIIDKDTMNSILFSVSLNKNSEVSSWLNKYNTFLDYLSKQRINYR